MTDTEFDYEARVEVRRPAPGYLSFTNGPGDSFPTLMTMHADEFSDMFGADVAKELNNRLFNNPSVWIAFGFRIE